MSVLESVTRPETYLAGADQRAKQFYLVELSTTVKDTVTVCDATSDLPVGAILNKPNTGEACVVGGQPGDIVPVISDGSGTAITIGDWVGTGSTGKAVKKSTDKDYVIGRALDASAADGTIIRVRWSPGYLSI